MIEILKRKSDNSVDKVHDMEVLDIVKQIIAEYQKQGVKIDSQESMLSFYIQQITELESMDDKVINEIIQTARICKNNGEGIQQKREWKEIEKELKDRNIDVRTICIASNIYSKGKNREMNRDSFD